jgi:hypothetical protein
MIASMLARSSILVLLTRLILFRSFDNSTQWSDIPTYSKAFAAYRLAKKKRHAARRLAAKNCNLARRLAKITQPFPFMRLPVELQEMIMTEYAKSIRMFVDIRSDRLTI